jgi:hypothetical protein
MLSVRLTCPLVAALASGIVAAPVLGHPPAPIDENGQPLEGKLHRWMHESKVPLVRGRVRVLREACPGQPTFAGCVFGARPRTLYLRPGARQPRSSFYHELGHVFDLEVLNRRERRAFKRIVGIRRAGWFGGDLPPVEWFADGYAECALRLRIGRRLSPTPYGYAPSAGRYERVCRLIRRAAAPRGRPPSPPKNPPEVIEVATPPPEQTEPSQECNLVDQLLTDCEPPPAPPAPPDPAPRLPAYSEPVG